MLFDKRIPAELLRVTAIVEEVMKKVGKSYKIRREINEFGNGFYVKNSDGESTVWFGVWYEIWAKRAFPLACCVSNDVGVTVINRFRRRFGKDAFLVDEDEGWTCYGIPPDKLTDKNNVRELARFLNHTVALLQK
jgi:hypothetical protein